jgi:peroxiredoxin
VSFYKDLGSRSGPLEALDATILGVSANSPKSNARFRDKIASPFAFLSDPQLTLADSLAVATQSGHPMALKYPKRAFLQPSVFIWRKDGQEAFSWRAKARLTNLLGAARRMSASDIVAKLEELAG